MPEEIATDIWLLVTSMASAATAPDLCHAMRRRHFWSCLPWLGWRGEGGSTRQPINL